MTNKVYADGKGLSYDYDAHGRLTKRTWARGINTFYSYDGWGNLTNTTYSDNTPTVTLAYDAMGRQVRAVDAAGVTTFAYDVFGSLTNETVVGVAGTNTIERFYDTFGRDMGYALNGVRQSTLAYDAATGRLASMQIPSIEEFNHHSPTPTLNSNFFTWSYLAGSDLKSSLTYPNGLTASWSYGNRGELLEANNASPTDTISQYTYTYDAVGRRISCAHSGSAFTSPDTNSYLYNIRSELTNATAAVNAAYRYGYDFDDIGNRMSSAECGVQSAEYVSNELNQYTNIVYSAVSPATCHLSPTYDPDGNQTLVKTATGIWSVTYNGENRPILWTQGTNTISMTYDRMGRRVTKNDQRFFYDGYLQICNFHSTTTTSDYNYFIWDPTEPVATRSLAWQRGTSVAYYTHDGNKNVSEVIASDGTLAAHYEYAPFGALTVQRGESYSANSWRFSSEYSDDEIGNVYYILRHYDPITGNWMMRDPAGELYGGLYGFCANNSISYWDSTGAFPPVLIPLGAAIAEEIARAAVAAAIAAAIAAVANQIADVTTMPRCPEPECLPCKPPVGTVGFRTDIVPPSKPHYPHKGTHTHLYIVNQSPVNKGCKCFWRPVKSIEGDIPPRGSVPMNGSPAGGGVTFK